MYITFHIMPFKKYKIHKKAKSHPLAPIAVEILVCRGSAHKIATDSGTINPKKPNHSAPKLIHQGLYKTKKKIQLTLNLFFNI
jgi:hypothetical protein